MKHAITGSKDILDEYSPSVRHSHRYRRLRSTHGTGITATLINSAAGNAPRMSPAHPARPALPKRL
jgi:hypothetical protein